MTDQIARRKSAGREIAGQSCRTQKKFAEDDDNNNASYSLEHQPSDWLRLSQLEFNVPFQHKYGYIRDEIG